MSRIAAPIRRVGKDTQGATAIEFAMVVWPFILLIGGITEIGIALFTEYTLQNAVQEAGRKIQTGQMEGKGVEQFKTEICDKAPNLKNCTRDLGVYVQNADTFTELARIVPSAKTIEPRRSTPFSTGVGEKAVAVMATYDWKFTFPFMRMFNNVEGARRLQGVAVFQNEKFGGT